MAKAKTDQLEREADQFLSDVGRNVKNIADDDQQPFNKQPVFLATMFPVLRQTITLL